MFKKRRSPAPSFGVPAPFNPLTGRTAGLSSDVDLARLAVFQVVEIYSDYLECKGFDPEHEVFLSSVPVAKPHALRVNPWNAATVEFPDYTADYAYTSSTKRTVTLNAGESDEEEYVEELTPPYWEGELLVCAKCRTRIGVTSGAPTVPGDVPDDEATIMEAIYDNAGHVIEWVDLNLAGRAWGSPSKARVISATLSAAWTSGATTDTDATVVDVLEGPEVSGTVRIYNVFDWDAGNGALVWARWNPVSQQWEAFQVECP